jgi:hypothetical protein
MLFLIGVNSDGQGFTGVFVALDIGIRSHEESKTSVVDLYELSKRLRQGRSGIIGTIQLYNYTYQVSNDAGYSKYSMCSISVYIALETFLLLLYFTLLYSTLLSTAVLFGRDASCKVITRNPGSTKKLSQESGIRGSGIRNPG